MMYTMGIDIGTRFLKISVVEDTKIVSYVSTVINRELNQLLDVSLKQVLATANISKSHIKNTIVTGYGSTLLQKKFDIISIPNCLIQAFYHLNPSFRTVIDVGGLFINIASCNERGDFVDTIQNESCAAGSGKFLETIAEALETKVEDLSAIAEQAVTPYKISNNCAVFAESEVISQVNTGRASPDIIAGLLQSIAIKVTILFKRMNAQNSIYLSGGLAKCDYFANYLAKLLEKPVISHYDLDSQAVASYGAALIAQKRYITK